MPAPNPPSVPGEADVVVTVTTRRYDHPNGQVVWSRESVATGPFDDAVLAALAARLHPWALGQVAGKVLARRPAVGEPVAYLGRFSDVREFLVAVGPAAQDDPQPARPCKTRLLKGLFLDYSAQEEQHASVA